MSRLKKAPLLEVIFELHWSMTEQDWEHYPYLYGDLYGALKKNYPKRQLLLPSDLPHEILTNKVQHRFQHINGHPLFQLGPGVLTYNTTDDYYEWQEYSSEIKNLLSHFFSLTLVSNKIYRPELNYYDFLPLDFDRENVLDYISNHLNITIRQDARKFEKNPHDLNIGFSYEIDQGNLNFQIDRGWRDKDSPGLILQTQLKASSGYDNKEEILKWLDYAHDFTSQFFKDLTMGPLYASFNS